MFKIECSNIIFNKKKRSLIKLKSPFLIIFSSILINNSKTLKALKTRGVLLLLLRFCTNSLAAKPNLRGHKAIFGNYLAHIQ